ncbi:MAG TPA: PLP-dependent aminotransferase family protein [Thermoanaerobaculia bacterium]
MLLLNLDESSPKPRYAQILEQLRQKIETRVLRPGDRLPSTRALAETLDVHRSTVALAYQELWTLGYLDMRPGARPRVRARPQIVTRAERPAKGILSWSGLTSPGANVLWEAQRRFESGVRPAAEPDSINFATLEIDPRLFPLEQFRSCVNRAIRKHGSRLFGYGDRAGFPPLRECIAGRLRDHGVSVAADQILITNGSQHAIDLVLRMLAAPGRTVVVESPTYDYLLPLVRSYGSRIVEVPLLDHGMDLDILERVFRRTRPALVYTMPSFHNPTGTSTGQEHRERLLSLCEARRVPLLEDGYEEEMKYFGRVVLPVKSMDPHGLVIYCGTFSKVLFPGARIGWVAADRECIERLAAIRRFSEISPNTVLQAAMFELCADGLYDRHVARMHRIFRRRMQTATEALRRCVSPKWAQWTEPAGGFLIWLELQPHAPFDWDGLFAAHGVGVTPGRTFFASATSRQYLRLSIASLGEDEIVEGIRRLGLALEAAYGAGKKNAAGDRSR